jgi:hypothetical protein
VTAPERSGGGEGADLRYGIPELTRGVRALGGAGDPVARACLLPLLAVRRALVGVTDPARQVALCRAAELRRQVEAALATLAAARAPDEPPRRRAEEARLEDAAAPVFRALEQLQVAATDLEAALRRPDAGAVAAAWTRWVEALQGAFRAAGDCVEARPRGYP